MGRIKFMFVPEWKDTVVVTDEGVHTLDNFIAGQGPVDDFYENHSLRSLKPWKKSCYAFLPCPDDDEPFNEWLENYGKKPGYSSIFTLNFGCNLLFHRTYNEVGEKWYEVSGCVPLHILRKMITAIETAYYNQKD